MSRTYGKDPWMEDGEGSTRAFPRAVSLTFGSLVKKNLPTYGKPMKRRLNNAQGYVRKALQSKQDLESFPSWMLQAQTPVE
jgi:hypothetical protein